MLLFIELKLQILFTYKTFILPKANRVLLAEESMKIFVEKFRMQEENYHHKSNSSFNECRRRSGLHRTKITNANNNVFEVKWLVLRKQMQLVTKALENCPSFAGFDFNK